MDNDQKGTEYLQNSNKINGIQNSNKIMECFRNNWQIKSKWNDFYTVLEIHDFKNVWKKLAKFEKTNQRNLSTVDIKNWNESKCMH